MKVGLITREYPPYVYGGAGVHVDFLARELRRLVDLEVLALGEPRPGAVTATELDPRFPEANAALQVLSANIALTALAESRDIVHSHTWYANMTGHLSKLLYGIPHVVSAHSLEPFRPWKAEQLGGGYRISSWAERTAYEAADAIIAVSQGTAADIRSCYPDVDADRIHVVYNGIDCDLYRPDPDRDVLDRLGIDPNRPYVTFVGRITRQKGVPHLLRAGLAFDPALQILLLAGAADTPELRAETDAAIEALSARRTGVVVVSEMLPREQVRQVLTHALLFACPSVYEPLGIVNLEAMACETAVVASAVGGIPEVVVDGETGLLVAYDEEHTETFELRFAEAVNTLAADPDRATAMGKAGRQRALDEFDWSAIARQTVGVYEQCLH
jgi:alpha-maltose-1-phosphate synthase